MGGRGGGGGDPKEISQENLTKLWVEKEKNRGECSNSGAGKTN